LLVHKRAAALARLDAREALPLKRPPPLHVMAQRASALSPGRTRSSSGSPGRGESA